MANDDRDEYLQGASGSDNAGDLTPRPAPSASRDLDDELTPMKSQASPVRIALYAGVFLFPIAPLLILAVAFLSSDGGFDTGAFAVAMTIFAAVTGALGLVILAVAGFLELAYGGRLGSEKEVFGSAVPGYDRDRAAPEQAAALGLNLAWGPALLYMIFFAGVQFARPLLPWEPGADQTIAEVIGGILNVLALMLFGFFWTTGWVRLNRAGVVISRNFYLFCLLGLAAFFLPLLLA